MKDRTFNMDLTPDGKMSRVLLDGEDISACLRGLRVEAGVDGPTVVHLIPAVGMRAQLTVRVPEAQVVIDDV